MRRTVRSPPIEKVELVNVQSVIGPIQQRARAWAESEWCLRKDRDDSSVLAAHETECHQPRQCHDEPPAPAHDSEPVANRLLDRAFVRSEVLELPAVRAPLRTQRRRPQAEGMYRRSRTLLRGTL